jgi:predicted membrane protein
MSSRTALRTTPQIIFGLGIVAVGVLLLLHNMGVIYAPSYFSYWPIILILIGLSSALQPSGSAGRWIGLILLVVGVLLLLDNLYVIDFYIWDYWPLLLVLAGLSLIRGTWRPRWASHGTSAPLAGSKEPGIRGFSLLGGQHLTSMSDDFQGGNVSAILGGCKVDLRGANMKTNEAVLEVFTLWGGIEILVPSTWVVQLEGFPILGGFEDKTHPSKESLEKKIIIRGSAIMGGVEVKN